MKSQFKKPNIAINRQHKQSSLINSYRFSVFTVINILIIGLLAGTVFIYFSRAATSNGDINNDGVVNITDLSLLLSSYGQNSATCITNSTFTCDLSNPQDNQVNILDLSILLSNYGKTITPPSPPPQPPTCTKTLSAGGSVQTFINSFTTGDVGCLRGGTYVGNFSIAKSSITLTSYPGERATLNTSSQIELTGANITVSNVNIVGSSGLTIRAYGDNNVIKGNDITNNHNGMSCIIVGGGTITTHNLSVIGNKIHGCGAIGSNLDHGIYASHFVDMTVTDNLFYDIGAYSIQLYPDATHAVITHNVIDGGNPSVRGGIVINGEPTSINHVIERNIIAYTVTGGIVATSGSNNQANYNCFFQNGGSNISGSVSQTGNITSDPLFINRSGRDYRLNSSSQCLSVVQYDTAAKLGF